MKQTLLEWQRPHYSTATSLPVPSLWVGKQNKASVWCVQRWLPHFAPVTLTLLIAAWRNIQFRPCKSRLDTHECKRKHSSVSYVNLLQDTTDVSWWAMTGEASLHGSLPFIILRWWWSWSCWTALIHVCSLVSCLTYYLVHLPKSSHWVSITPKAPNSLLKALAWLASLKLRDYC